MQSKENNGGSTRSSRTAEKVSALVEVRLSGYEKVDPSPDILDSLERDYPLEASVADLVDNSIDADARRVLIRFIRNGERLVSLCVADNGKGIKKRDATRAMTFADRRRYGSHDLGMFGVGMKTASLSHASKLILASRAKGDVPVGRRWTKPGIKKHGWRLDLLTTDSAAEILEHEWGEVGRINEKGTVVRWDDVADFERLHAGVDEYLDNAKTRIANHLGLKLHRFIERRKIRIFLDVEDALTGEVGPPSEVRAMNPFPPANASGARGYPKDYLVSLPGSGRLKMRAYIWRKKSQEEGYKLGGGRVAEHQGFYFFRHDRLIQDGGWCGLIGTNEPHMSLARVECDIPDELGTYLKVRSNKAGVDVPASFGTAVMEARARDGSRFGDFLKRADEVYRHRGVQRLKPMLEPGSGIPAEVRRALENESVRFVRGPKCGIKWGPRDGAGLIHLDQSERLIVLNRSYRKMLLRGAKAGATDLPLLRTLLYFCFESVLAGDRIGPVERARLNAIQAAMTAALKLEQQLAEE